MTNVQHEITEATLNKNLNELAHSLVRELAMATKKIAIYGTGHPLSRKSLDKPWMVLQSIFRYKRYASLNVQKGSLYVLSICVKDTVFNAQILQYMQMLDIHSLLFERSMTMRDFTICAENLVQRESLYDPEFSLAAALKEYNVESIQVNSEFAHNLFENGRKYRGEFDGEFTVRRFVLDQLGDDLRQLAALYASGCGNMAECGIDFDVEIVKYLLPEKVASFEPDNIRQQLESLVAMIRGHDGTPEERERVVNEYAAIFRLLEYHPNRQEIAAHLDPGAGQNDEPPRVYDEDRATGRIKIASQNRVDQLLKEVFQPDGHNVVGAFGEAYHRLLTTGQADKAREVLTHLLDQLGSPEPDARQKALSLILITLEHFSSASQTSLTGFVVDETARRVAASKDTYEYSELLYKLIYGALQAKNYAQMVTLIDAMTSRRSINDGVTVYESMAVKKAFEQINQRAVIDALVEEMIRDTHGSGPAVKTLLIGIGSEEVALALSSIISHHSRAVRQLSLKILAELGKASLTVFTRILNDDSWFEREEGRHELPNAKWYVIRNSIFVLGSLEDPDAVAPLRLRLADPDVRVRREVVRSLEKIGGEDAVDCLIFMAEDAVEEIREAAIIAIGLIGSADSAPLLIDLLRRTGHQPAKTVTALGKLGGPEARAFLGELLDDDQKFSELAGGRISKDDLRLAIIKALGEIGDNDSIERIKAFRDRQSTASKLFFKNSSVNKAISDILARQ